MAYATVADLEARWRPLGDGEQSPAVAALEDASAQIRAEVPDLPERLTTDGPEGDLATLARRVACSMVRRAMAATDTGFGVTATQETQGPFSRQFSYANPMGDLYLTRAEKRLLGAGGQRAFTIDQGPDELPGNGWAWLA